MELQSGIMGNVMYTTPVLPTAIKNILHTVPETDIEHSIDSSAEDISNQILNVIFLVIIVFFNHKRNTGKTTME